MELGMVLGISSMITAPLTTFPLPSPGLEIKVPAPLRSLLASGPQPRPEPRASPASPRAAPSLRRPSAHRRCAHPLPAERCSPWPQSVTCSARRARAGADGHPSFSGGQCPWPTDLQFKCNPGQEQLGARRRTSPRARGRICAGASAYAHTRESRSRERPPLAALVATLVAFGKASGEAHEGFH
ncbi:hypothetical protein ACRRTK_015600 [Alexandromys fortis]